VPCRTGCIPHLTGLACVGTIWAVIQALLGRHIPHLLALPFPYMVPSVDYTVTSGLSKALPIALVLLLGFLLLFRKRPAERLLAFRSMVLMFLLFMIVQFLFLLFHEGGHALNIVWRGVPVTLYVHPFFFAGFSRPSIDATSIWPHILGSATSTPIALLISLLSWRCRSPALLPLAILFPWVALSDGINITGIMGGMSGDFVNVVQITGLPAAPFVILGASIFCIGLISLLSLFPSPVWIRAIIEPFSLFLLRCS